MALAKVNVYSKGKVGGGDQLTISKTLNDNSWEIISAISRTGLGDTYWDIGDCKEITLNGNIGSYLTLTNETLCVFILHFNLTMNGNVDNNIVWGGFKTALTNGVDVALCDSKYNRLVYDGSVCFTMNHTGQTTSSSKAGYYSTNYGGWKGTDLRYDILGATSAAPSQYNVNKTKANVGYDATPMTLINPPANTLLAALPADFRNVLRLWSRWIDAVGNNSNVDANIKETVDAVTLLAEFEVFGVRTYANQYEQNHQTQMNYYKNGNSKVKYNNSATSTAVLWWCASPGIDYATCFCTVYTSGKIIVRKDALYNLSLAPAFLT